MRVLPEARAIARGEASGYGPLAGLNLSRRRDVGRVDWEGGEGAKIQPTYQLRAVERAYGGKGVYEAQKAAGKTALGYHQWLQVRTPEFKAWFGDWESLRAQRKVDAMEPVAVTVPDE